MGSSGQDPPPGGAVDDADPPAAADDLLAAAVAELYGADPQEFTDRRKALAAAAKAGGDAAAARQIAALRKPTRAAWVVNRLARADPGAPARLADLSAALLAAQEAKDGPRLRELSAARGPLIDGMTSQALAAADVADPPAGLRDEVSATLTAALADPEVAAGFAAGTLTRAAEWAGFGVASFGAGDAGEAGSPKPAAASAQALTPLEERRLRREQRERDEAARRLSGRSQGLTGDVEEEREREASPAGQVSRLPTERRAKDGRTGVASRRLEEATVRKERLTEEARLRRERLAQERAAQLAEEAAQAAERRRKIFEDAERAVASASAAAIDAVAKEDRLETEVRDLEERLTRARAELADARLAARRSENAERKARRTLEGLPRPNED